MPRNTAGVRHRRAHSFNSPFEKHHAEPFAAVGGHYIGQDGFIVPRNFDEFIGRFPHYVQDWVRRHARREAQPEDLEDWTQDLLIHLEFLPSTSKYRGAGKQDVVQTFDPVRHYGASKRRFLNYINLCLANKFRTMYAARKNDVLLRAGNVSLFCQGEGEGGQAGDEYCHSHSERLRIASERMAKLAEARHLVAELAEFVRHKDEALLPAMEAMLVAGTQAGAARLLRVTESQCAYACARLRQMGRCLTNNEPVPRGRRA